MGDLSQTAPHPPLLYDDGVGCETTRVHVNLAFAHGIACWVKPCDNLAVELCGVLWPC